MKKILILIPILSLMAFNWGHFSMEQSTKTEEIPLGDFVDNYDFGASLYTSNQTDIEELLTSIKKKYKGKTVILDLWGTFCKPCLRDFENSTEIKKELKQNDIQMVYLCAGISSAPQKWEEVISQFELVGDHVYLDRQMTRGFMSKFGFKRYPSYLVIDKDGEYKKNIVFGVANLRIESFLKKI